MRKRSLFAVGLIIAVVMTVTACGGGTPSASATVNAGGSDEAAMSTVQATSTDAPSSSNSAAPMPVLTGSNINTIVEELEKSGFPKVILTKSADANEYINNKTDAQSGNALSCDVYYTKDDAVISAVFTIENTKATENSAFIKMAEDYLKFCAGLKYSDANADDIKTWIQDNIKNANTTGVTKTFGDAMINMYGTTDDKGNIQAVWLEVYKAGA